jgi:hypothetical protein
MTVEPGWVPPGVDTSKANIARVYDYWLGGSHNFQADQDAARTLIAMEPNVREIVRANRAFLGRAVRFLASPREPNSGNTGTSSTIKSVLSRSAEAIPAE